MRSFRAWRKRPADILYEERRLQTYVIRCFDPDESLWKILHAIKSHGNGGHSFSVIIDPEAEKETFGWDGDGADRIESITKQG